MRILGKCWSTVAAVLAVGAAVLAFPSTASAEAPTVERIAGENRYDTAARLAQATCVVAIANGEVFADGLAGAVFGVPILLTRAAALPEETISELDAIRTDCPEGRIQAILIFGGEAAVSAGVADELGTYAKTVKRLGGANRYETAITIAQAFGAGEGDTVLLASGQNFPDALAAGPFSSRAGYPLVLNDGEELRSDVVEFLSESGVAEVIIVGGSAAVPATIESEVRLLPGIDAVRVAGADRFETAARVADVFDVECAMLVNGHAFADALAAAPLASSRGCAIVLVDRDRLPLASELWLRDKAGAVKSVIAVGGTTVVSQAVLDAAVAVAAPPPVPKSVAGSEIIAP